MNFGRNFAKFADFGHVRIFFSNEFQNPASDSFGPGDKIKTLLLRSIQSIHEMRITVESKHLR